MIITNFALPQTDKFQLVSVKKLNPFASAGLADIFFIINNRAKVRALLIANPSTVELAVIYFLKLLGLARYSIFTFDLILKWPKSKVEKIIARFKGIFIAKVDYILAIHRDTSGYENRYGIKKSKFIYVPFKANNFGYKERYEIGDKKYVVALGASQRDYATFISAVDGLPINAIIVCSDENAKNHNANVGNQNDYPKNVRRITQGVSQDEWCQYIADSSFVVVPISRVAIQPAGISVYLEAMALKKAVIVTEGASVNGILEHGKNALIVAPEDPVSLRSSIELLLANEKLKQEVADAGYLYALSLKNDPRLRSDILQEILSRV